MDTSSDGAKDAEGPARSQPRTRRTMRGSKVFATTALAVGMAAGGFGIAHAATSNSSNSSTSSTNSSSAWSSAYPATPSRGAFNPLDGSHAGPGETLLTGDKAAKATAAAKAAVPGGTILRVETDANQGATYEAHVKKSDGSCVTVLMDANFKVTSTVPFGPGARGPHGAMGQLEVGTQVMRGASAHRRSRP